MVDSDDRSGTQAELPSVLAAAERALGCRITHRERLPSAVVNHVFALRCGKRRLVLKSGAAEGIRREAAVLAMLRDTTVPVPRVVRADASLLPDDLLLMPMWDGQPAAPDSPALTEAGVALREVHSIGLPGFGSLSGDHAPPRGTHDTWSGFLRESVEQALAAVPATILDRAAREAIAAQITRHAGHLATVGSGVLLHGDLVPRHVWSDRGRLVGLIDWGDAMVGDPLYDLARVSMAGTDALRLLLRGYAPQSPPDSRVVSFYRMVWSLCSLAVECGAGGDWIEGYPSTIHRELRSLQTASTADGA